MWKRHPKDLFPACIARQHKADVSFFCSKSDLQMPLQHKHLSHKSSPEIDIAARLGVPLPHLSTQTLV